MALLHALLFASLASYAIAYQLAASTGRRTGALYSKAPSVVDALRADPNHSTFAALFASSILPEDASRARTIFVPTNAAFSKIDKETLSRLMDRRKENLPTVQQIMKMHILAERATKEELGERVEKKDGRLCSSYRNLANIDLVVSPVRSGLFGSGPVSGFKLGPEAQIARSVECADGMLHEVDALLTPYALFRYLVGSFPTP